MIQFTKTKEANEYNDCKFLEITNKDMLEISQICGFNSSAYFSNVFKKIMKDSPSEYRQKQKKSITP